MSASWAQGLQAFFLGEYPEFYDSRFTTANDGRSAARVESSGVVKIVFTVHVRGAAALGFEMGPSKSSTSRA